MLQGIRGGRELRADLHQLSGDNTRLGPDSHSPLLQKAVNV